jgi:hypothetical protein
LQSRACRLAEQARTPEGIVKKILLTLAAAAAGAAMAPVPASAQMWWTAPVVVDAGTGLVIVGGPFGPTVVAVPVVTTARPVTVGPLLRVSGCYWARERGPGPGGWIRFRVCS